MARRSRGPRFPSSKFIAPGAPSRLVHRPRLFEPLDEGRERRLTLVVGSPGAGKTVLLGDWLASRPDRPSAWLACDMADENPVRFFAAVIEACRRGFRRPELGEDARQLLSLDGEISADVVAALSDDLEREGRPLVLVIDDLHLAGARGVEALGLLLGYRPPTLQLVLATRVDPPLRLQRMRANQEITELRDRELSFSPAETAQFLSGFHVQLAAGDLAVVQQRSEGWAAGVQMAALSIHDAADPADAARRVELRGRTVAGYFLDEVLYHQPLEVVDFMLAMSVLDEVSPGVCTAICGDSAPQLLESVYRANLFLVLVDEETRTYRFHQLIREVLKSELHARDPAREQALRKSAAAYLADNGNASLAARQLLAAGEPAAAFALISERLIIDFQDNRMLGSAFDMEDMQPAAFTGAAEVLVPLAGDLLLRGAFERGRHALELARKADFDHEKSPELALKLAFINLFYWYCTGQFGQAIENYRTLSPPAVMSAELKDWADAADVTIMLCHAYGGDATEAGALADAMAAVEASATVREVLIAGAKSEALLRAGALGEAHTLASGSLAAARRLGFDRHYFAFHALRTTALLALEKCQVKGAAELTEEALRTLVAGRPIFECLAQLDRARIWAAEGNLDEALASLPAARAALRSDRSAHFAEANELEARFRLALGDLAGAETAAEDLPDDRRLVLAASIALAAGNAEEAIRSLDGLAAKDGTVRLDLEVRLLRAEVAVVQGSPQVEQLVKGALGAAERYGYLQTVLNTAPRLLEHVVLYAERYPRTEYLQTLISAALEARRAGLGTANATRLSSPLTVAELRVLEKLPLRLSYAELATDLHLSLNTVKTHLQHTYMKLGVTSRSDAVKRATALGLV